MDDRKSRSDTDYRVLNGKGRPVFRVNIKFHGSPFRKAQEMVGLPPEDCFALATYKIHTALQKQDTEHLPYIFIIVGVPGLTGKTVGQSIPEDLARLCALAHALPKITGKRGIEDAVISALAGAPAAFAFKDVWDDYYARIRAAPWFALSAKRAVEKLTEMLFDRVYALRVRGFTRNYPGAELDMHFSLAQDLTRLEDFLRVLRDDGMQGLVSRLTSGTF